MTLLNPPYLHVVTHIRMVSRMRIKSICKGRQALKTIDGDDLRGKKAYSQES
jgi:hypothetical protein